MYKYTTSGPWPMTNQETETEWKYKVEDDTLYIVFKGSSGDWRNIDWKQNFSFWVVPYKNQPVKWYAHAGFVKKWKSVRDEVIQVIRGSNCSYVHVSGFSQGGAIATLALEDIRFTFPEKASAGKIYGAPRAVWFWNYHKIKGRWMGLMKFELYKDIVPKVPFKIMGYTTAGKSAKIGKRGISFPWQWKEIHMSYKNYF